MKHLILSTLILFSLTASSLPAQQADNSINEEYEVLSALLNENYLTGQGLSRDHGRRYLHSTSDLNRLKALSIAIRRT